MNLGKINTAARLPALRSCLQYSSSAKAELPASLVGEEDEEAAYPQAVDRSGLQPQHKNVLLNKLPYQEPHSWIHMTEKYQRQAFGRYGAQSNVNPKICFDSRGEKDGRQVMQLETLLKMLEKNRAHKAEELEKITAREEDIAKKMEKLKQWKADLHAKVAKREADAAAAIQRKERLVEEVRRHFGFKVDTRDERFKEMLEQKEKEDKRKQKEAKRKAKEEKMMAKLVEKTSA
ncbi:growth arrest and DNA damage-inducible proteins-interacting protein 1 [Drosophila subpulchrella]|uniref:growth arrest and DNA damage-inducible proteins-interacting protein 1 n=1 Tax=Drosophila subpulchrella TaxID=1486046 RepID=UPI0018A16FF1|nr:growth arrest and DNA damage-inducible proteins-interacting protein 1 [Drosophila subpulchrella]